MVQRFPIELWAEEFEDRFSAVCQSRASEMIDKGLEVSIDSLLEDLDQDLDSLLRIAPPRLVPAFRRRSIVIARRTLIKTREIFRDDPLIRSLIVLSRRPEAGTNQKRERS